MGTGRRHTTSHNMAYRKRLDMELKRKVPSLPAGFSAQPKAPGSLEYDCAIRATCAGETGIFRFKMTYTEKYPFEAPKVQFETPIYHPNFDQKGNVCIKMLTDGWAPSIQIDKIMGALASLLENPEPDHPLSADIAVEFTQNRALSDRKLADSIKKFAQMKGDLMAD